MAIAQLAVDKHGRAIQVLKASTNQNATTNTSTSTAVTNAVAADCIVIRVVVSTDSYVVVGTNPSATSSSMFMAAGAAEYFRIDQNNTTKVAALALASAGVLSVTEMF